MLDRKSNNYLSYAVMKTDLLTNLESSKSQFCRAIRTDYTVY